MTSDSIYYIIKTFRYILLALVVLFFIRFFVIEIGMVESFSMEPTMQDDDMFLVEKFSLLFYPPQRGEIIQLVSPTTATSSVVLIKRVIGLPGEEIKIDAKGQVKIINTSGQVIELSEPYATPYHVFDKVPKEIDVIVPLQTYFVMGDNRPHSVDSRNFGPVHRALIFGRVFPLKF